MDDASCLLPLMTSYGGLSLSFHFRDLFRPSSMTLAIGIFVEATLWRQPKWSFCGQGMMRHGTCVTLIILRFMYTWPDRAAISGNTMKAADGCPSCSCPPYCQGTRKRLIPKTGKDKANISLKRFKKSFYFAHRSMVQRSDGSSAAHDSYCASAAPSPNL